MTSFRAATLLRRWLAAGVVLCVLSCPLLAQGVPGQDGDAALDAGQAGAAGAAGATSLDNLAQPVTPKDAVLLDRVVAVIDNDVILQSDVLEEERFEQLQPFQARGAGNADQQALERVINRTLILQQLKELQKVPAITDAELRAQLGEVRKHLPVCGGGKCESDAGWKAVLAEHGFTPEEFQERWRVRMLVLAFIEQRFRAGVRISKPEIQEYYDKSLTPEFRKRKMPPPSLATVAARIDEILLQQHVNGLLEEWLNSLKDQGSVAILDPAYRQVANELPASNASDAEGAQD